MRFFIIRLLLKSSERQLIVSSLIMKAARTKRIYNSLNDEVELNDLMKLKNKLNI